MQQKSKSTEKHRKDQKQSQLNAYLKYSGLAFQMLGTIGVAVWGGMQLDAYLGLRFPVFLLVFTLLAVVASLILTIKGLPKQ